MITMYYDLCVLYLYVAMKQMAICMQQSSRCLPRVDYNYTSPIFYHQITMFLQYNLTSKDGLRSFLHSLSTFSIDGG